MMFDQLCKFVETIDGVGKTDVKVISDDLRTASRFHIPPSDKYKLDEEDKIEFHLPFTSITIEDNFSCTLISRVDGKIKTSGLKHFRIDSNDNNEDTFFISIFKSDNQTDFAVLVGKFDIKDKIFLNNVSIFHAALFSPENRYVKWAGNANDFPRDTVIRIIQDVVNRVLFINQPSKFVVEVIPHRIRDPKSKLIPRSHERPYFTLLSPAEIKRRYVVDTHFTGTGTQKTPHAKRGHFRTLESERFTNKRGQRIWINACWVGPKEATVGNKKYKVRLDV